MSKKYSFAITAAVLVGFTFPSSAYFYLATALLLSALVPVAIKVGNPEFNIRPYFEPLAAGWALNMLAYGASYVAYAMG
jgi:hypothetical protein